eukprot:GHVR01068811.1.p1 GENE.GHVR01068811.1~~GHVR01068811.1.p1  ORF type:complete len:116 (-),score=8.75 GHVR01068811.1:119-466(-)
MACIRIRFQFGYHNVDCDADFPSDTTLKKIKATLLKEKWPLQEQIPSSEVTRIRMMFNGVELTDNDTIGSILPTDHNIDYPITVQCLPLVKEGNTGEGVIIDRKPVENSNCCASM